MQTRKQSFYPASLQSEPFARHSLHCWNTCSPVIEAYEERSILEMEDKDSDLLVRWANRLGAVYLTKCLDLSRLPKVPGFRSINVRPLFFVSHSFLKHRNVTLGPPLLSLFPGTASYNPAHTVDPTHPAATQWKSPAFPHFSCPAICYALYQRMRSAMVPRGEMEGRFQETRHEHILLDFEK
ncbi:hypothetical protein EV424DRAFT_1423774 [Suillus variegatus]|nr:hypothetical protein EV424DRAFT_1423774 [Suillus variegatus]